MVWKYFTCAENEVLLSSLTAGIWKMPLKSEATEYLEKQLYFTSI